VTATKNNINIKILHGEKIIICSNYDYELYVVNIIPKIKLRYTIWIFCKLGTTFLFLNSEYHIISNEWLVNYNNLEYF